MELIKVTRANRIGIVVGKDTLTWEISIYVWEGEWIDEDDDVMHILKWWTKYPLEFWKRFFNI